MQDSKFARKVKKQGFQKINNYLKVNLDFFTKAIYNQNYQQKESKISKKNSIRNYIQQIKPKIANYI